MRAADWLIKTITELENAGIPLAQTDAEWIMCDVLGITMSDLLISKNRLLGETQIHDLDALAARRKNREPLQYILGTAPFYELTLKTSRDVLIPREDSVAVVELALKNMSNEKTLKVLDLCCGTGAIGLLLAVRAPNCRATFVDISSAAITCYQENMALLNLQDRSQCLQSDMFDAEKKEKFDIIL
ncbi:MAG: peptide chain release factor N(5)-glutamine methyltransferase, partial [Clostridia bacterium]|nr:peptide chain release factor N(5)-glutamine methyltransferase [Clostridia bacterium]